MYQERWKLSDCTEFKPVLKLNNNNNNNNNQQQ